MAKDSTQVLTAGPSTNLWLAPISTAEPAAFGTAFSASWTNVGYLKDPPSWDRSVDKNELFVWNALEALRTFDNTETNEVTLNFVQTNRAVFELYFGALTYVTETGGIRIEPNPVGAVVEKSLCLELIDGSNILRVYWRRAAVSNVGNFNMDKADAISYELTMKRLIPATGQSFSIQTNVSGLVTP